MHACVRARPVHQVALEVFLDGARSRDAHGTVPCTQRKWAGGGMHACMQACAAVTLCTRSRLKCSRMEPAVGMSRALSAPTMLSTSRASAGPVITCARHTRHPPSAMQQQPPGLRANPGHANHHTLVPTTPPVVSEH